jgi:alpha-amylase
LNTNSD